MNKVVKKIVNDNYQCELCLQSEVCKFWEGSDDAKYVEKCDADTFADGIRATMEHLNKMPWNEALNEIGKYNEDCNERH